MVDLDKGRFLNLQLFKRFRVLFRVPIQLLVPGFPNNHVLLVPVSHLLIASYSVDVVLLQVIQSTVPPNQKLDVSIRYILALGKGFPLKLDSCDLVLQSTSTTFQCPSLYYQIIQALLAFRHLLLNLHSFACRVVVGLHPSFFNLLSIEQHVQFLLFQDAPKSASEGLI